MKVEKNRRYECQCCGTDFSHAEGLKYADVVEVRDAEGNLLHKNRRSVQCPMCGSPKRYLIKYLGSEIEE